MNHIFCDDTKWCSGALRHRISSRITLVPHICVSESGQHWFRYCVVAKPLSEPMLINGTLGNKLQWTFIQNSNFVIHKNAFENVVCEMAAILSWVRWVNNIRSAHTFHYRVWIINTCVSGSNAHNWLACVLLIPGKYHPSGHIIHVFCNPV